MKIEKVNDHQIRCTLTKTDLADRELKISELAYGTEKAKNLFRDMMQQASLKFGFEAEDIPLMIEAIPLNSECIVLIITKVEDPEELDTRFSKFAPSVHDEDKIIDEAINSVPESASDVLDLFKRIHESQFSDTLENDENTESLANADKVIKHVEVTTIDLTKFYSFNSLRELTHLAQVLNGYYMGINSLYKNTKKDTRYILVISKSEHTPEQFNKICNILSEYGTVEKSVSATEAFLEEHFEPLIKNRALQALMTI